MCKVMFNYFIHRDFVFIENWNLKKKIRKRRLGVYERPVDFWLSQAKALVVGQPVTSEWLRQLKKGSEKTGVPNLLCRCGNTGNGYIPSSEATDRSKGATRGWAVEFEHSEKREIGQSFVLREAAHF